MAGKRFPIGWSVEAKLCDACKMAAASLFCRTDSIYMCIDCDSKHHGNNIHERVWMCEVCEQAPASVTCKADAAALCVRCDRDIHSANPLASRHERVPVLPFFNNAVSVVKSAGAIAVEIPVVPESNPAVIGYKNCKKDLCAGHEEININNNNNSWLQSTNCDGSIAKLSADIQADMKSIEFLFSDPDNLLEFDYPVPNHPQPLYNHHQNSGFDSVVPVQANIKPPAPLQQSSLIDQSADNPFEIDFTSSNISNSFNTSYTAQSISQHIPTSSIDVGVVPDGSCMSDISYPFALQTNNNLNSSGTGNCQSSIAMDREARVMRYREKRKNRKFEKTIRYASRKAYAETRPRIKGRFAKRSEDREDQADVDQWFPSGPVTTNFMGNSSFGVVPSF